MRRRRARIGLLILAHFSVPVDRSERAATSDRLCDHGGGRYVAAEGCQRHRGGPWRSSAAEGLTRGLALALLICNKLGQNRRRRRPADRPTRKRRHLGSAGGRRTTGGGSGLHPGPPWRRLASLWPPVAAFRLTWPPVERRHRTERALRVEKQPLLARFRSPGAPQNRPGGP